VPEDIISKLNGELTRIVNSANVREYLLTAGFEVQTGTPQQFGEFISQEITKWGTVVRSAGLKMRDSP
jgi:tripartite-type tricarboxylate transporter receptor subunit TctC